MVGITGGRNLIHTTRRYAHLVVELPHFPVSLLVLFRIAHVRRALHRPLEHPKNESENHLLAGTADDG